VNHGNRAVVASGHPLVTRAAAEILKKGGNAFDAAVAAGFAGSVAEPTLTSLGGGGFLLALTLDGMETLFDFFVDTPGSGLPVESLEPHFFPVTIRFPGSDQVFNVGLGSAAVPGNLKGFLHVHEKLGSLPLKEVVAPAAGYARHGVPMNYHQAYFLHMLRPIMTLTPQASDLFAPGEKLLRKGDIYTNPELAEFLENISEDRGFSFYQGEIAARIAADMIKGQGLLTEEDLKSYSVIERRPFRVHYRDRILLTNTFPSFGGPLIGLALKLMEQASLGKLAFQSPEHMLTLFSVMSEIENIREQGCHCPEDLPPDWLEKTGRKIRTFSRGTTHVSIADAYGNVASMTTSNGEGSGYIVPGTGIMLNNMMGEDDLHPEGFHGTPPGHRVASMMSPSILLRDGTVELVLGSGGSKRIRTAIMQVVSNISDFRLGLNDAIHASRIHWDGSVLQAEPGLPDTAIEALEKHCEVNIWQKADVYFGGVNAVIPGKYGAGDPRRGGDSTVVISSSDCL